MTDSGGSTTALTTAQQKFLQRLMASHVLTDDDASDLWEQLCVEDENGATQDDASSLPLGVINAQLTAGFGLEICSIKLEGVKYHTLINQHADKMAELAFDHEFTPHERAYVRAVLECLVQKHANNDDENQEQEDDQQPSSGVSRMNLINLRTQISKPYNMPSVNDASDCVDRLVSEAWLVETGKLPAKRRKSMMQTYELGPRAYLELSNLLVDLGFPKEDLPQFLLHRT